MSTPQYGWGPIPRGNTRQGIIREPQKGGSAAGRLQYIQRGGDHNNCVEDVLALGYAGPDLGDWVVVDRAVIRKDGVVAMS